MLYNLQAAVACLWEASSKSPETKRVSSAELPIFGFSIEIHGWVLIDAGKAYVHVQVIIKCISVTSTWGNFDFFFQNEKRNGASS